MKYIIKKPDGGTMTSTLEMLAIKYDNGVVRSDWPAKPESGTDWSTVGTLLTISTPSPAVDTQTTSTASGKITQTTSPSFEKFTSSAYRRYEDAYLVARVTTSIGKVVQLVGIGLGLLIVVAATIFFIQTDKPAAGLVSGLFIGAVVAIPIYVLGVLVAAQGEITKATLDSAVHGSPFLKEEDIARVMSL